MNAAELILPPRKNASDVHLVCGEPPVFRIAGKLERQAEFPAMTRSKMEQMAAELAAEKLEELRKVGEIDASTTIAGVRVRINLFRQENGTSAAIRLLADQIPPLHTLGLPPKVDELCNLRQGFLLVTGETAIRN